MCLLFEPLINLPTLPKAKFQWPVIITKRNEKGTATTNRKRSVEKAAVKRAMKATEK